jgi:hypothetical protein
MSGVVNSYSGNTLVLTVDLTGGSGTFSDWNINLAGDRGATGGTFSTVTKGSIPIGDGFNVVALSVGANGTTPVADSSQATGVRWAASREVLTANRTYFIRTDGSNSNNGLTNTSGGAFSTIQKAIDVVFGTLDLGGFNVTIQVGDGTYTGSTFVNFPQVGAGIVTVQGNASTPENVLISTTGDCFRVDAPGAGLRLKDLKLQTTNGYGLVANGGSKITFLNVNFGACAISHMASSMSGFLQAESNYVISGNSLCHIDINNGTVLVGGRTITFSGTPAFVVAFVRVNNGGLAQVWSNTFSGSATGSRYTVSGNGVIQTFGAGATAFPGNSAGSTATGGQYL